MAHINHRVTATACGFQIVVFQKRHQARGLMLAIHRNAEVQITVLLELADRVTRWVVKELRHTQALTGGAELGGGGNSPFLRLQSR